MSVNLWRNSLFRGFVILKTIEREICLDPLLCGPSLEFGKEVQIQTAVHHCKYCDVDIFIYHLPNVIIFWWNLLGSVKIHKIKTVDFFSFFFLVRGKEKKHIRKKMKTFRLVLHPIKLGDGRSKSSYRVKSPLSTYQAISFYFCLLQKYPEGFLSTLLALGIRIENGVAINCGGFKLCACFVLPCNEYNCN